MELQKITTVVKTACIVVLTIVVACCLIKITSNVSEVKNRINNQLDETRIGSLANKSNRAFGKVNEAGERLNTALKSADERGIANIFYSGVSTKTSEERERDREEKNREELKINVDFPGGVDFIDNDDQAVNSPGLFDRIVSAVFQHPNVY